MPVTPAIAVILPVYNGERYLAGAIASILQQTYRDFELMVIDDGSTDRSVDIVKRFSDERVRLILLGKHEGFVPALNTGIRQSHSEFIARMDADDISLPRRFERQLGFLNDHPEVGICGTLARDFGDRRGTRSVPVRPADIRARLFFGWAMDHPTLMLRRSVVERHDLFYREDFRNSADLDLLMRAAELTDLANVPEVLLLYRNHARSVTSTLNAEQNEILAQLVRRQLRTLLPEVVPDEEELHVRVAMNLVTAPELPAAEQWLARLGDANRDTGRYEREAFERELRARWYFIHRFGLLRGISAITSYWKSPLSRGAGMGMRQHASLFARSVLRSFVR